MKNSCSKEQCFGFSGGGGGLQGGEGGRCERERREDSEMAEERRREIYIRNICCGGESFEVLFL